MYLTDYLDPVPVHNTFSPRGREGSLSFEVTHNRSRSRPRQGILQVGNRVVRTPCVWFGLPPNRTPRLWEYLEDPNLLVNAASIACFGPGKRDRLIRLSKDIARQCTLMMDSGGFQIQKRGEIPLDPRDILRVYSEVSPDLAVILDHPLSPSRSLRSNRDAWQKTLANTKWMLEHNGVTNLVPVVHGYGRRTLRTACEDLSELLNPEVVGLGSLVPLVMRSKISSQLLAKWGSANQFIEEAIQIVRDFFPSAMLHVFGIGSTHSIRRVLWSGGDSVDTLSWRIKAAHGAIIVPGGVDRFVSPRGRRVGLDKNDKEQLAKCECPICRSEPLARRLRLLDNRRNGTFENRAIHNAFAVSREVTRSHSSDSEGWQST